MCMSGASSSNYRYASWESLGLVTPGESPTLGDMSSIYTDAEYGGTQTASGETAKVWGPKTYKGGVGDMVWDEDAANPWSVLAGAPGLGTRGAYQIRSPEEYEWDNPDHTIYGDMLIKQQEMVSAGYSSEEITKMASAHMAGTAYTRPPSQSDLRSQSQQDELKLLQEQLAGLRKTFSARYETEDAGPNYGTTTLTLPSGQTQTTTTEPAGAGGGGGESRRRGRSRRDRSQRTGDGLNLGGAYGLRIRQ